VTVAKPAALPVTKPVAEPMVKIVAAVLQEPPPGEELRVIVAPAQSEEGPVMGAGEELIVIVVVETHPPGALFEKTTAPLVRAFTTPNEETVATDGALLNHVPLPDIVLRLAAFPVHMVAGPNIGKKEFTVTVVVCVQPDAVVYAMIDVPAETPFTKPLPEPIVATGVLPLVQVPPPGEELNVEVLPRHKDVVPETGAGV
jgi:hypothetical protein